MLVNLDRVEDFIRRRSGIGPRYGPFILPKGAGEEEMLALAEERKHILDEVEQRELSGVIGTYWAPTAAHAAVFLERLQEVCKFRHDAKDSPAITFLFRGQRDAGWKLNTSHYRALDKTMATRTTSLFSCLLSEIGNRAMAVDLPPSIYEAVSQHYQFATNLLDFTPDAHVAVHFAAAPDPNPAEEACVYFAPISALSETKTEVLLPPPMFDRIQRQRGVFLRSSSPLPESLFSRIIFPANSGFPVYRNGKVIDVMAEPSWIVAARDLTRQVAQQKPAPNEVDKLLHKLAATTKDLPYANRVVEDLAMSAFAQWLDFYEEMRYWLACTMDSTSEYFWSAPLNLIEKSNPDLVDLHDRLMAMAGRQY